MVTYVFRLVFPFSCDLTGVFLSPVFRAGTPSLRVAFLPFLFAFPSSPSLFPLPLPFPSSPCLLSLSLFSFPSFLLLREQKQCISILLSLIAIILHAVALVYRHLQENQSHPSTNCSAVAKRTDFSLFTLIIPGHPSGLA
eukprot:m.172418 g.172418  ORF g.172418 m.172418 type:complete len:140 (-) comp16517_c2_seq3:2722-3141(-)